MHRAKRGRFVVADSWERQDVRLDQLGDRTDDAQSLDRLVARLDGLFPDGLATDPLRRVLSGEWLGHALHPLLTDFPLGAWMSATLLDLVQHRDAERAVQLLTAFGIVASVPTALTGASEWKASATTPGDRRTGAVHAMVNSTALLCYSAAWWSRRRRHPLVATTLGLLGGTAATVGGYFGGHLSLARGVGVARRGGARTTELRVATGQGAGTEGVVEGTGERDEIRR